MLVCFHLCVRWYVGNLTYLTPSQLSLICFLQGNAPLFVCAVDLFKQNCLRVLWEATCSSLCSTVMSVTEIEEGIRLNKKNRLDCFCHRYTRDQGTAFIVFYEAAPRCWPTPWNSPYHFLIAPRLTLRCVLPHKSAQVCALFFPFFFSAPTCWILATCPLWGVFKVQEDNERWVADA